MSWDLLPNLSSIPVTSKHNGITTILDTNVLRYALNPELEKQIFNTLEKFDKTARKHKNKSILTISEATIFEFLQNQDAKELELNKKLLEKFKCFPVDRNVQYIAARIAAYYRKKGENIKDSTDLYIAATSFITASGVLTANENDFPSNFFKESLEFPISWKNNKNRTQRITLYILTVPYMELKDKFFHVM